jgi:hypothetical protein
MMKISQTILGLCLILLLMGSVVASDWTERHQEHGILGYGSDTLRTDCSPDFIVTSLPYFNNANLIGAGNDCLIRSSEEHIYQVNITATGLYTFSTCGSTNNLDTYIYLRTGCCSGVALASDNNSCNFQPGPSVIECFPLSPGTYYLIVEAQSPSAEGPYSLSITQCTNPCEQVFQQDGVHPNDDGSFTWVQTTDESDESPLYEGPFPSSNPCAEFDTLYGFGYYSWYDQDYGWRHVWPGYDPEGGVCVQSVRVYICAYDVDESDCNAQHPGHPEQCELDHVFGDNELLNPEYLSGQNGQWSVTVFDIPPAAILNDGQLNMFIDIDVWNDVCTWATTLNWSQLVVTYRATQCNNPPYTPEGTYTACVTDDSAMCVEVTGPVPADPDNDPVTYTYRWFVSNQFTGFGFVDDENNPSHPVDHAGPCVPASDSDLGDTWRVVVFAVDNHGTQSVQPWTITFLPIVPACGPGPLQGWDLGDLDPECYPTGTDETGGPANPIHQNNLAWLGDLVTADLAVDPGADQGDDGVAFLGTTWMPCQQACVDVTVTTGPGYAGEPLFIYAWKDGNLNCNWTDSFCPQNDVFTAPECIIGGVPVIDMSANQSRTVHLCFIDPGVLDLGRYDGRLRFRLVSQQVGCAEGFVGVDPLLGETEDYVITDLQLDVQLTSFTAIQNGAVVDIRWTTASETNSDHFIVERFSAQAWHNVSGNIAAAGQSTQERHYVFTDSNVQSGTTYGYRLIAVDANNVRQVLDQTEVTVLDEPPAVIEEYALYQNFPNPFNPSTTITYDMKDAGHVTLQVFDLLGREVALLVNGSRAMGRHQVTFDGQELPSGVYIYRLETPGFASMQKMVLMK